ncbi:MAG: ATP-dependent helicase, partial [Ectothiorhodospiraceae bacterium]
CAAVNKAGRDDQAIYEWRHARPQNLRDFIEGFDATVYRLERNYRSTDAIVSSGAHLVRNNVQRLDKAPFAVRSGEAAPVTLVEYDDGDAMADGVVERLAASLARGRTPDDLAVLYRKNRLGRGLEAALLRQGIPYRIKAGTDLLGYADVRMMLAVGRLAANRRDLRALARVADLVPGLGARSVARLSAGRGDPLEGAARLAPRASAAVERLSAGLERLRQRGPGGLAEWCQRDSLFRGWLLRRARRGQAGQGDEEALLRPALGRMAVVQRAMDRRLATLPTEAPVEARWAAALEVVATGTDEADETEGRVTLSTVHGAKGLEWPEVHVYGFSEGLMPMAREGEIDNLAEERRLAYVALTRAQDAAVLHHADALDLGTGQGREAMTLSRFVGELGPDDALCRTDRRRGHAPTADASEWLAAMRRAVDGG